MQLHGPGDPTTLPPSGSAPASGYSQMLPRLVHTAAMLPQSLVWHCWLKPPSEGMEQNPLAQSELAWQKPHSGCARQLQALSPVSQTWPSLAQVLVEQLVVWQKFDKPPSVGMAQRPLTQSALLWQLPQRTWGGLQLQEPSVAQTPVWQAPASFWQPVIWQAPEPPSDGIAQRPLTQSELAMQKLHTDAGLQLQVSSPAQMPPAAPQAEPASSWQLMVLHAPLVSQ